MDTGIHNKLTVFKRVLWRNFSWLGSNYSNHYLVSKSHTMFHLWLNVLTLSDQNAHDCLHPWSVDLIGTCCSSFDSICSSSSSSPPACLQLHIWQTLRNLGLSMINQCEYFPAEIHDMTTSQREQTWDKQGRGGRKASCIYLLVGRAWCWGNREQLLTAKDVQREESRTTNCFKGLQVEQGRAGTGDVHMQAGKVSGVQSCDQSRSEQLFPSFLARNWLLLCYLLFLASSHFMPHVLPSAPVTF